MLSAAQATWYLKSPASDVEQTFAGSVKTKTKKCPLLDNAINYLFLVVKNLGAMKLLFRVYLPNAIQWGNQENNLN